MKKLLSLILALTLLLVPASEALGAEPSVVGSPVITPTAEATVTPPADESTADAPADTTTAEEAAATLPAGGTAAATADPTPADSSQETSGSPDPTGGTAADTADPTPADSSQETSSSADPADASTADTVPADTTTAEEAAGTLPTDGTAAATADATPADSSQETSGSADPTDGNTAAGSADPTDESTPGALPTQKPTKTPTKKPTPTPGAILIEENLSEVLAGAAASTPRYASATPADGQSYVIGCVSNSNYCIAVANNSRQDNANIHTYKKSNSPAQFFTLKKLSDGSFVIYNYRSDMVLTVAGSKAVSRANVSQRAFANSNLQKWVLRRNSDGSYSIRSKANTRLALHIYTGKVKNGQNIRLYTAINSNAQRFVFEKATPTNYSGEIVLRPRYFGYASIGSGGRHSEGANLKLEVGASDDPYQTFTLKRVWGSFYKIVHKASGRVVDVAGGKAANGANVQLYTWNGSNAQLWQIQVNSGGTYTFRSRCNLNYVLDVAGRGKAMGTNLQLYSANGTASQMFIIKQIGAMFTRDIDLTISSLVNTDRVFTAAKSKFMSYDYSNTAIKKFVMKPVTHSGTKNYWYRIITTNNKVLGVSKINSNSPSSGSSATATSASNSLTITEQKWTGARAQLWHPEYQTDGTYVIRSALNSAFVIDLKGGNEDYRATIQIYSDTGSKAQRWHLSSYTVKSCKISSSDHNTVTLQAVGETVRSDDKKAYLFAVESYEHSLAGKSPIAKTTMGSTVTFTAPLNKNSSSSLLQKKFYVAVKYCNTYRIVSNAYYITNPEAAATNTRAFPKPARGTKKGLKLSISNQDIEHGKSMKISYACIDIILDNFLNGSDYAYTYEGKTYRFSSEINYYRQQIKKYNDAGIVVTANVYLLSKRHTDFLQPEARNGKRLWDSSIVAFNTRDAGRKRVEALFACIADAFTTNGCLISNWVFANEVNEYICFYYSGDISYNRFHESLAEGYRMFNACVKSRWKNARCYVSIDHNWNLSWKLAESYMGMDLIKDFNLDLSRQGRVHWDITMHPYPAPEQDPRFWNRSWTVTNSGDTQQVTMLNMRSWAVYMKMTYGTSLHIILNETGLSSTYNGTEMLNEQAAALALEYYMAEFDNNIDTMDYHRNIDDPGETADGWHLGLYYKPASGWNYSRPKPSANVFRYMDSASWNEATRQYVSLTGKSSYAAWVPGFDASRFAGKA